MPLQENRYDSIIICGERFKVSGDARIVTFKDPGGMSFEKARASENALSDYYSARRAKGNPVTRLDELAGLLTMIVLHTDLTPTSAECFNTLVRRGLSTHFMIDLDGTIYQSVDLRDASYHAGEVNNFSIGIDLNNEMPNLLENRDYKYTPPAEKNLERPLSETMVINGTRCRSYGYSDAQYVALLELLKTLVKLFPNIKPESPFNEKGEIITTMLEDMNFPGIVGHWHISPTRWDPGPGFDWQRIFHGLASEHNFFPVEIEKGRNIASLLIPEKIREAAGEICLANERGESGGYYPIGINQNWHGGIHIPCHRGTPVMAATKGVLAAARIGDGVELGDNNFVLLRHDIKLPKERVLKVFSLYMHLQKMPLDGGVGCVEWVKAAHRVKSGLDSEEEGGRKEEKKPGKAGVEEEGGGLDEKRGKFF
ncbi:MAG: N-acetylmuramoyl-L-alanine amidase, partial [Deltaproteobacteria bacterium]|nr:N-acetylmuramoyl-L-alanine amidase [Deltaproteobacteria bacterium]